MSDAVPCKAIQIGARATRKLVAWPEAKVASAPHDVFDEAAFDAIADILGPAKTLSTLQKLLIELEMRFVPAVHSTESRERFARDAHVVTSIAGMLGFTDLSRRCAELLALQPDDAGFEAAGSAIVEAKAAASRQLLALIGERDTRARVA